MSSEYYHQSSRAPARHYDAPPIATERDLYQEIVEEVQETRRFVDKLLARLFYLEKLVKDYAPHASTYPPFERRSSYDQRDDGATGYVPRAYVPHSPDQATHTPTAVNPWRRKSIGSHSRTGITCYTRRVVIVHGLHLSSHRDGQSTEIPHNFGRDHGGLSVLLTMNELIVIVDLAAKILLPHQRLHGRFPARMPRNKNGSSHAMTCALEKFGSLVMCRLSFQQLCRCQESDEGPFTRMTDILKM